jgi:hypothetical protein
MGESRGDKVRIWTDVPLQFPSTPPVYMYIPHTPVTSQYHLKGPYPKPTNFIPEGSMTFQRLTHQMLLTFGLLPPLIPQQHQTCPRRIGTSPHDTMAPSTIMWIPIYGRLGTRRLGTVTLSSQGSL